MNTLRTLEAIAIQAKVMLDQQRTYFKTKSDHPGKYQALNASKQEESKLRLMVSEATKVPSNDKKTQAMIEAICILITEVFQWQQTYFNAAWGTPEKYAALDKCRQDLEPKLREAIKDSLSFVQNHQTPSLF